MYPFNWQYVVASSFVGPTCNDCNFYLKLLFAVTVPADEHTHIP